MPMIDVAIPATRQSPIERVVGGNDDTIRDTALAAHFLYGGACGALVAALHREPGPAEGAAAGVAIWVELFRLGAGARHPQAPSEHPGRRNAVMIAAHLAWGAATALALRELYLARRTILNDRPVQD